MQNLKFVELTEQIISCAFEVHKIMGIGFLEKVYENAMLGELKSRGMKAESQRGITVRYKNNIVGEYFADIIVEDIIIIELKALDKLNDIHELQMKNYLKATGIEVGLLINFGKSVEVKRKYVQNINAQETGLASGLPWIKAFDVKSRVIEVIPRLKKVWLQDDCWNEKRLCYGRKGFRKT